MNKIVMFFLGILSIIFGLIIIVFSVKGKYKRDDVLWNNQMRFKGIIGGFLFVYLGFAIILNERS